MILSLGVHEAAHAWTAWKLGDSTAKDMGRMTVNPIVHIDMFMTIILPTICVITGAPIFGGAKPVPVNFNRLKNPWVDMAVVAFAGPLSNLLLACLFMALWKFFVLTGYYNGAAELAVGRVDDLLPRVMAGAMSFNVVLFVFNLVPIPPLDGSRIVVNLLPDSLKEGYMRLGAFGLVIILVLINFVPGFGSLLRTTMSHVMQLVEKVVSLGGAW
ncbi:MAG: site-2 protease family protein [Planctomycetes bacterium]|nr:site-2 protease family protein [Planctomycetota bacterium]